MYSVAWQPKFHGYRSHIISFRVVYNLNLSLCVVIILLGMCFPLKIYAYIIVIGVGRGGGAEGYTSPTIYTYMVFSVIKIQYLIGTKHLPPSRVPTGNSFLYYAYYS